MAKKRQNNRHEKRATPVIRVLVSKRAWLLREIKMSGDLQAVLEYNARGLLMGNVEPDGTLAAPTGGVVKVYGRDICQLRRRPVGNGTYGASFVLMDNDRKFDVSVRARIELGFVPRVSSFTVAVNGVAVYEELLGRIIKPSSTEETLPIPSSPSTESDALPIPAADVDRDPDALPIPGAVSDGRE